MISPMFATFVTRDSSLKAAWSGTNELMEQRRLINVLFVRVVLPKNDTLKVI